MSERLVLCGGAMSAGGDSPLRLALDGRLQNITLKLEDIGKRLVAKVPALLVDLIEIATYVYCADQATSRGGEAQAAMGSDWRRDFRFVIPVRHPDHWSDPKVLGPLCDTISFLSEDNYVFEFEKATNPTELDNYLGLSEDSGTFKADEVVLFSGGLDSLSGAIEELSAGKTHVALVSHRSSPKIFEHQKQLVEELKRQFPKRLMHVPVLVTGREPLKVQEYTQRTRSFLYAALACVVAQLFRNTRIRFFENGVVSINLPISEQVVGARATRTTHPLVLEFFRRFFSVAIGARIEVENPFVWKTKAEVVRSIVDHGCGRLIKHTVSCTRSYAMTRLHSHCGCCSQCLDRRFGVIAADAAEHDPVERYKIELLTGERERPNDQTMAESYVRTALELRDIDERAFFDRFSGETSRVCSGFPVQRPDDVACRVLGLHQRHGRAIGNVLTSAVKYHSAELIERSVPPSSVLMMAVAPGRVPALARVGRRSGQLDTWLDKETKSTSVDGAAAGYGAQRRRAKNRPTLDRARGAIEELYPNGVPSQSAEPNVNLCRRVGEKLKKTGLPNVSNDTILRAAGRRK
jgi:7-cyano-7-deazaguanine synthase in queuosine biosynthesis